MKRIGNSSPFCFRFTFVKRHLASREIWLISFKRIYMNLYWGNTWAEAVGRHCTQSTHLLYHEDREYKKRKVIYNTVDFSNLI